MTAIRIKVGAKTIVGRLADNATARDLAGQLPITVSLVDYNGVEKVGTLPRPLSMDGVPPGADPDIDDIGYYQPTNGLVFYYGDVGYYTGIVRIGRLSADGMQFMRSQHGRFTIDIHRQDP